MNQKRDMKDPVMVDLNRYEREEVEAARDAERIAQERDDMKRAILTNVADMEGLLREADSEMLCKALIGLHNSWDEAKAGKIESTTAIAWANCVASELEGMATEYAKTCVKG